MAAYCGLLAMSVKHPFRNFCRGLCPAAKETVLDDARRTAAERALHPGIAKRALTRQFREETGLSFAKWRNVALAKRARELLAKR
jgi:AraC-like DNA-binding protein